MAIPGRASRRAAQVRSRRRTAIHTAVKSVRRRHGHPGHATAPRRRTRRRWDRPPAPDADMPSPIVMTQRRETRVRSTECYAPTPSGSCRCAVLAATAGRRQGPAPGAGVRTPTHPPSGGVRPARAVRAMPITSVSRTPSAGRDPAGRRTASGSHRTSAPGPPPYPGQGSPGIRSRTGRTGRPASPARRTTCCVGWWSSASPSGCASVSPRG